MGRTQGVQGKVSASDIVELIKLACSVDQKIEISGGVEGGIDVVKFVRSGGREGAGGKVTLGISQLRNTIDAVNSEVEQAENRRIASCMAPYVHKLLDQLLETSETAPIEDYIAKLPKNQKMKPGIPLFVLDGKVKILLTRIKEHYDTVHACFEVSAPSRAQRGGCLTNGKSLTFPYFDDSTFQLTASEVKIYSETANITIIEQ